MADERPRSPQYRPGRRSYGCGGFLFVLIVGVALSLFNTAIGIGVSLRIPFTASNVTIAAAVGGKTKTVEALPSYAQNRLAANQNFINYSQTLTIAPAEGAFLVVIGRQAGAPAIDLELVAR